MSKDHIIIHHSLTKDSGTFSWSAIRKYHIETEKWLDIGYHYGVELVGDVYEALVGRPEQMDGAACYQQGMNKKGIQICCVGNFDEVEPSNEMLDALVKRLIVPLCIRYSIVPANIKGHRDFASYKSCPGTKFNLDTLRGLVWKSLKNQ